MLTSGAHLDLTVEKPAAGGRMIARHDGRVVLVAGAIPGERVRVRVERAERSLAFATVVEVLESSPDRRPVTGDPACGGCVYAHVMYARQLRLKAEIVADAFRRIGKIGLPDDVTVMPSPEQGYRLRARLHVRGGRVGFFREGTHDLCDAAATGQLLPATADVLVAIEAELSRLRAQNVVSIELSENIAADQRALHLSLRPGQGPAPSTFAGLARVAGVTGVTCQAPPDAVVSLGGHPFVADPLETLLDRREGTLGGGRLVRRATAFFQANRYLLPRLVPHVVSRAGAGDVVDLYAGVGLFAVALAALGCERVTAVEGDRTGAADLEENARPFAGRLIVERAAVEAYLRDARPADAYILDPPRTGLSRAALDGVIARGPARLVYVSCDVATLARDVGRLVTTGYAIAEREAFDLFPNTAHVETLVVLDRAA